MSDVNGELEVVGEQDYQQKQPKVPNASDNKAPSSVTVCGYGGWLAFFCTIQIYISPLIAVITGAIAITQVLEVSGRYPSLVALSVIELTGDIAVVCFGVYAGLKLRRLQRGAVGFAKSYLIARLVWAVLSLGLPYMGGNLPSQVVSAMTIEVVKGLIQTIFAFVIWFSYFNVSKRIKATFPEG